MTERVIGALVSAVALGGNSPLQLSPSFVATAIVQTIIFTHLSYCISLTGQWEPCLHFCLPVSPSLQKSTSGPETSARLCDCPEGSCGVWPLTSALVLPSCTSSSYTGPPCPEHAKLFPTPGLFKTLTFHNA